MVGSRLRFLSRTILFLAAAAAWCQSFSEPAHGLAQKIAAVVKPPAQVTIALRNLSSMSPADASAAQAGLERELRALGLTLAERIPSGIEVQVTLSENLRDFVWVAEIRRPVASDNAEPDATAREVVIEESPKPPAATGTESMLIDKKLILEEDRRILDLAPLGRGLVVLDEEAVSIYESAGAGWQPKLFVRIPVSRPWPRDLRGRILVQGRASAQVGAQNNAQAGAYQAYLPGLTCNGNAGGGLSITCREESLWPIGAGPRMLGLAQFTPMRNFFSGRIVAPNGSEKSLPPFFSGAEFQVRETTAWALAGVDGRTYLYNTPIKNSGAWAGLGSSIAGIETECGGRSQVFASSPGDGTVADSVRAYDIVDGTPRPAGAVAFSGPVTELWPAAERGVVFAISRDLKSGRYAAFRLAITCAH
jgi:hypothetical protein